MKGNRDGFGRWRRFFGLTKLACVPKNKEQNVWIRKKIVFIDRNRLHGFEGVLGSAISFDNINIRQAAMTKHHRKKRTQPQHSKSSTLVLSRYTDTLDDMETISDDGDDFLA